MDPVHRCDVLIDFFVEETRIEAVTAKNLDELKFSFWSVGKGSRLSSHTRKLLIFEEKIVNALIVKRGICSTAY